MRPKPDDQYLLGLALAAFEQACDRFTVERHSVEAAYAPAGEALFWIIVCDDGYESILDQTVYRKTRNADVDGGLIVGIRWARNRMTHQRALVFEKHDGTELGTWVLGLGALGTMDHMKWAAADAIPRGRGDFGRDVYENRMQGVAVSETIEACRRWFSSEPLSRLSRAGTG